MMRDRKEYANVCLLCTEALDQELVLEEKGLRNYGTDPTRSEQPGHGGDQGDKKNDPIAHQRVVAAREIPRNHGRNNNSPATD
jgi:hypothetical protein